MRVRWDLLFADLVAQLDAADVQADAHALADLTRAERATVSLADRLRASRGWPVALELVDGSRVNGEVREVGVEWVLIDERPWQHLVPLRATTVVAGLSSHAVPEPSGSRAGLGLPSALRVLMRDRGTVHVRTVSCRVVGRIARVGKDHIDVEELELGSRSGRTVPFGALVSVSGT